MFLGVLVILKVASSPQLQMWVKPILIDPPPWHEVLKQRWPQLLQLKEEDWQHGIPI